MAAYQSLDYQNQAIGQDRVGDGDSFTAWDYATDPTKIVWSTS